MGLPVYLLVATAVAYLMLLAGDWLNDGGRPTEVALPMNEGGYAKILRHGVLPWAHDRDDEIRAHLDAVRRRSGLRRRWAVVVYRVFLSLVVVGCAVVAVVDRSALALLAAVGWAGYPFACRWKGRRTLARYDRIEADLDRRRR